MTRGGFLRALGLLVAAGATGCQMKCEYERKATLRRARQLPPQPMTQADLTAIWRKVQKPLRDASEEIVRAYDILWEV